MLRLLMQADGRLHKTWYDAEVKAADGTLVSGEILGLLVQGHSNQFRLAVESVAGSP